MADSNAEKRLRMDPGTGPDATDYELNWFGRNDVAVMVAGSDIVHITDIMEDDSATVRVFASTHPDSPVLFEARVDLTHRAADDE